MKTYVKPSIEISTFHAEENIAASSIFEYVDGSTVPVTMFGLEETGWNGGTPS